MSDPVSNSEIEDVLASIRRLVSENAKALKGDRTRDPEAEKLVLTPALRIDENEAQATPSDVFAVDTDTWNDVSREAEAAESKGIFSHRAQRSEAVSKSFGERTTPVDDAPNPRAEDAAPASMTGDEIAAAAPGGADGSAVEAAPVQGEDAAVTGADTPAETESPKPASPAATALEQRIAELETAMDLRPKTEDTAASGPVSERAQAAEAEAGPETGPEAPAAAAPAAEAPPKSWIEGLVAAAAAAEATRIAERNKSREAAQAAAAPAAEAVVAEDETADQAEAEPAGEAAEAGPLELTEAEAVASELEAEQAEDDAVSDAISETDVMESAADRAAEVVVDTQAEDDADSAPAAGAETAAAPERSWVDRLIAAAATLRDAPEKGEEEADAEDHAAAAVDDTAVEAGTQPEEALNDVIEEAAEDAAEAAEADAPLTLEPLSLVDPIAVEAEVEDEVENEATAVEEAVANLETAPEADAAVPEWEEVAPPALDVTEETEEPEAEGDTAVLTGPWTAAVVESDADAAEETVEATAEAQETGDAAAAAEEVPVGALEWEPVSPPEETAEEVEGAAGAEAGATEHGDVDLDPQEFDDQEETDPVVDTAHEGEDIDTEPEGEDFEGLDEDAAAVAAAAEAEVDWESAGLASAGVASASAFYDETDHDEPGAEEAAEAADDAEAGAETGAGPDTPRRELVDETVIDEAMLRELVAQIVRDELQGTVGERITHNVRRLIRREIARALTLQDLEK